MTMTLINVLQNCKKVCKINFCQVSTPYTVTQTSKDFNPQVQSILIRFTASWFSDYIVTKKTTYDKQLSLEKIPILIAL